MKDKECKGLFSTGKCVLTRKEFISYGLNEGSLSKGMTRMICLAVDEYGECDAILVPGDLKKIKKESRR